MLYYLFDDSVTKHTGVLVYLTVLIFHGYILCLYYLQSPFPEEKGYALPLKETQRLNQLSDIKKSLVFSRMEKALPVLKSPVVHYPSQCIQSKTEESVNEQGFFSSPSSAAALKPSDVIELQKHVSPIIAKQVQRSGRINNSLISTGVSGSATNNQQLSPSNSQGKV